MKKLSYAFLALTFLGITSIRLQSQVKPAPSSGALLLQIKAANDAMLTRQTATLEVLKAMEADTNQLRIVAKRG